MTKMRSIFPDEDAVQGKSQPPTGEPGRVPPSQRLGSGPEERRSAGEKQTRRRQHGSLLCQPASAAPREKPITPPGARTPDRNAASPNGAACYLGEERSPDPPLTGLAKRMELVCRGVDSGLGGTGLDCSLGVRRPLAEGPPSLLTPARCRKFTPQTRL